MCMREVCVVYLCVSECVSVCVWLRGAGKVRDVFSNMIIHSVVNGRYSEVFKASL